MAFDRAVVADSLEPPVFRLRRRRGFRRETVVVGRPLSILQLERFSHRFEQLRSGELDDLGFARLVRELCDTMFPPPGWWAWRRVNVAAEILTMPFDEAMEWLRSFSMSRPLAHTATAPRSGTMMMELKGTSPRMMRPGRPGIRQLSSSPV